MKTTFTLRLLVVLISILLAISIWQTLYTADSFHCVIIPKMGICYWYHGK